MTTGSATSSYRTRGGVTVRRTVQDISVRDAIEPVISALDDRRGVLLASSYEYPGRYTRWDMGFANPPLVVTTRGRSVEVKALNSRGALLLPPVETAGRALDSVESVERSGDSVRIIVKTPSGAFVEEQRSRQPSVFSVLRALIDVFRDPGEPHLGLYGGSSLGDQDS